MAGPARREKFDLPEPVRRFLEGEWDTMSMKVEEFREDNVVVVKAELPGIDPEKNVHISVTEGVLRIQAERKEESEQKFKEGYRSEFRYGSFTRDISLPAGCREEDVRATYRDGVLEVRIPVPEKGATSSKIPVSRA